MIRNIWKNTISLAVLITILLTMFPFSVYAKENVKKLDLTGEVKWELQGRDLNTIAGKEYKPSKSQIDSMKKQNASYDAYVPDTLRKEKPYDKMSDEEFNSVPFLLGNAKDFQIFFTAPCDQLIVKTADEKYVKIDTYFTITSKDYNPDYAQFDYDGDGEDELIIEFVQCHGMGYTYLNALGLLVIDRDNNGKWVAYHPLFEDVMKQFNDKVYAVKESSNSASLYVNDKKIGSNIEFDGKEKINSMELSLDSFIDFIPDGEDIYVEIIPYILGFYKDASYLPAFASCENKCYMKMNYKGNGKFSYGLITTGQSGYDVFEDKVSELRQSEGYAYLEGPGLDNAVLLVSKNNFASSDWRVQPKEIEGFILDKGKLVSIGKVKADYSTYGFRRTSGGLIYGDSHKFEIIVPDIKGKCWKVYESASEDGKCVDSKGKISNDSKIYEKIKSKYYAADILYLR